MRHIYTQNHPSRGILWKSCEKFCKVYKKKPVPGSTFPVNFAKFLKIPFHRTPLVVGSLYRSYETER